jgi:hypothetical protein
MTVRRCHDCRRVLTQPPAGWVRGQPLGPKCWRDRAGTARRAASWRPAVRPRATDDGIDLLDVLAEMGDESALAGDGNDH